MVFDAKSFLLGYFLSAFRFLGSLPAHSSPDFMSTKLLLKMNSLVLRPSFASTLGLSTAQAFHRPFLHPGLWLDLMALANLYFCCF